MNNKNKIFLSNFEFDQIKDEAVVLDVRTKSERTFLPCFANDEHCYFQDLVACCLERYPDKNILLITYCNSGHRSSIAAEALRDKGYDRVFALEHGVFGWQKYLKSKT